MQRLGPTEKDGQATTEVPFLPSWFQLHRPFDVFLSLCKAKKEGEKKGKTLLYFSIFLSQSSIIFFFRLIQFFFIPFHFILNSNKTLHCKSLIFVGEASFTHLTHS